MEKEDLIQSAFLGFVIAVFFKVFDFMFNYPLLLTQSQSPYSNSILERGIYIFEDVEESD